MAWTYTYDTNTPLGSTSPTGGDDRIRETKLAIQERLNDAYDGTDDAGDQFWPLNGTEVDEQYACQHRYLTFRAPDPTNANLNSGEGRLYTSDITELDGADVFAELHWKNENNDTLQITWTDGSVCELYHPFVRFAAPLAAKPDPVNVNTGILYTKDVSAKAELHWVDEDEQECQLTTVGILNITAAAINAADTNIVDDSTLTHTAGVLEIKVPTVVDGDTGGIAAPVIQRGTYTGNGADDRAIDVGFTIRHLTIKRVDGGVNPGVELISATAGNYAWSQASAAIVTIVTLAGTTFVVDDDDRVNGSGKTYAWFAVGER